MQHAPHPDRAGNDQYAGDQEVGDLDPSQIAIAQQAHIVMQELEARAGKALDQRYYDIEWARMIPQVSSDLVALAVMSMVTLDAPALCVRFAFRIGFSLS